MTDLDKKGLTGGTSAGSELIMQLPGQLRSLLGDPAQSAFSLRRRSTVPPPSSCGAADDVHREGQVAEMREVLWE